MEFKSTLFAVLIVSLIIIATGIIIEQWSDPYSSGLNFDLGGVSKLEDISEVAGTQQGQINPQSGEASSDFETSTFKGSYGIITSIFSPFRVIFGEGGMLDAVATMFGVPGYILQTLITMIVIAITYTIIAIVFRRNKDTV